MKKKKKKGYVLLYVSTPEGLSDPLKSHTDNIKVLQMLHVFLIAASFIAGIVFSSVASTDDSNYDSDDDNDGGLNYDSDDDDDDREAAASGTKTKRWKREGSGSRNNHHYHNQIKFVR